MTAIRNKGIEFLYFKYPRLWRSENELKKTVTSCLLSWRGHQIPAVALTREILWYAIQLLPQHMKGFGWFVMIDEAFQKGIGKHGKSQDVGTAVTQ